MQQNHIFTTSNHLTRSSQISNNWKINWLNSFGSNRYLINEHSNLNNATFKYCHRSTNSRHENEWTFKTLQCQFELVYTWQSKYRISLTAQLHNALNKTIRLWASFVLEHCNWRQLSNTSAVMTILLSICRGWFFES